MSMLFGDAESLYKRLLAFSANSTHQITYEGDTYCIEHTQFARFPLRDLFVALVEETETNPLETDSEYDSAFAKEALEALSVSEAYVGDDVHYFYTRREHVKEHDLKSVIRKYETAVKESNAPEEERKELEELGRLSAFEPQAETRREAIAEVLSVLNAYTASILCDFSSLRICDEDDDSKPDPGVNLKQAYSALQHAVTVNHGQAVLSRPDPSLSLVREMYTLYEEIGMNPDVREVYGVLVDPHPVNHSVVPNFSRYSTRGEITRWTSEDEPPLTSLDSVDR